MKHLTHLARRGLDNEVGNFSDLLFDKRVWHRRLADAHCIPKLQAVWSSYDADPRRREEYLPRRMGALQWDAHAVVASKTEATARGVGMMEITNG